MYVCICIYTHKCTQTHTNTQTHTHLTHHRITTQFLPITLYCWVGGPSLLLLPKSQRKRTKLPRDPPKIHGEIFRSMAYHAYILLYIISCLINCLIPFILALCSDLPVICIWVCVWTHCPFQQKIPTR